MMPSRLCALNRQTQAGRSIPSGFQADGLRAYILPVWALVCLVSLVSCGGGSSSHGNDVPPPPDNTLTGFLIDSAVSGVAYETATQHGVTGPQGDFRYEQGETVRFSIGGTLLGEVEAQERITPFDLAHSEAVAGVATIMQVLNRRHHPFHTTINISILLQSLDDDGDPANGIQITPQVVDLLQGVNLGVDQRWDAFGSQLPLRHAVMQANSLGLFSRPHGVVSQATALQHLYTALEIDPEIYAVTLNEEDRNGDGMVDWTFSARYDENGNQIWLKHDTLNRFPSQIFTSSYSDSGKLVYEERDDLADGTVDVTSTLQYDIYGNLSQRTDVHSNIVSDGVPWVLITTYQYDADGNMTQQQRSDGQFNWVETYQYDANGNQARIERDEDGDGLPEYILVLQYHYSPEGMLLRVDSDENGDGTVDRTEIHTYDDSGNLISLEYGHDNDGDGTIDTRSIYSYEYDSHGNLTRSLVDGNGDGKPQSISRYDATENLILVENVTHSDSNRRSIESYSYDNRGIRTEYVWGDDEDGDGTLDSVLQKAQYDANGWVIRIEYFDRDILEIYSRAFEPTGWGYIFDQLCLTKTHLWVRPCLRLF